MLLSLINYKICSCNIYSLHYKLNIQVWVSKLESFNNYAKYMKLKYTLSSAKN